ncbi:AGC family protein kinase [Tritrichomonas foetus]|uniref:AGC family protein kinase n=1 Tax=Tritrichomonas foetus TaxID=1144522 RepID=A0A1J4KNP8_9EUKA|nr:AGC family protein kinase [Tritrichomonas foetus]|eukprot:OHT11420.1 AGC family protein kinase [Tritrichomonas foetus]
MEACQASFRLEDFIVDAPIGQGAFGQIYRATEQRSGRQFALKALNRRFLMKVKKQNQPVLEKNALLRCNCLFVVHLFGTFKDDSNLYFVFELAEHGDLAEAINDIGSLNVEVVRLLAAQLLIAMTTCHQNNVIHRDIKPENILLNANNHVKLTDFGTALINNEGTNGLVRSSIVGTPAFVAPELLNDGQICFSSDLWSFACVIFNCLTGVAPFEGETQPELMENITAIKLNPAFERLPRHAKDLIMKLLVLDPTQRIGYGEVKDGYPSIRNHPFFAEVDWKNIYSVKMPLFTKFEEEPPPTIADDMLDPGEKVVLQGEMMNKRKLSWPERIVFLTSNKRLLLFNPKNNKFKHEIKLLPGSRVEGVSANGKEWTLNSGKAQHIFKCKDGTSGMWAATIMREMLKQ